MIPIPARLLFILAAMAALARAQPAPISVPRFTHPGAGQVFYFVLTDRFANGNPANDAGGIAGGPDISGFDPTRIGFYHGGDLPGLIAKLDYIKGLGATAVWVTPPFRNKPMQLGSAGYHGYWILDFLHVDPHLGTDADFRELVAQAHARGLKVYLDIIVNHTADVIKYQGGKTDYVSRSLAPYRDAQGRPFDVGAVAYNGVNSPGLFPALSADRSFAYVPVVPADEAQAKSPAWLNDPVYYHNRGNSLFKDESALDGDFSGLDDLMTENPAVVRGFIDIYGQWIDGFGADGFRIDTTRHVNLEFWQAFAPAMRERARRAGRTGFIQFGEVANGSGDVPYLSEFSTTAPLDATLDFGFFGAARAYVSEGKGAGVLDDLFAQDDYYTDHDSNVQATTTFLGNHDAGRFGYFLQRDNPRATPEQLARLVEFGHALLLLVRGQPVIYYGDEQGMIGRGGGDMQAREDMFAASAPDFKNAALLGTTRTGADDKFDPQHPFYRFIAGLATLRDHSPALRRGAMIVRPTGQPGLFAFSRIERTERVEYLAAFNNSRTESATTTLQTCQPAGAGLQLVTATAEPADAPAATLTTDAEGRVSVTLAPLHFALWRAAKPLPVPAQAPGIAFTRPGAGAVLSFPPHQLDGDLMVERQELRAELTGSDGLAEVTFTMARASRPGQYELLGTDDAAPYRVFWRPPADLAPGEELTFIATVDDLRGHRAAARIGGLKIDGVATALLAAYTPAFGVHGAKVPVLQTRPPAAVPAVVGAPLTLAVQADGTGPLEYQWLHDGAEIPGATAAVFTVPHADAASAGRYAVLVHGLAGSVLSAETAVTVAPATGAARMEKHPAFPSKSVPAREVDVWLPPGYDTNPAESYPVIYMHDGQNLFDSATSFGGVPWAVDQAMLRLIAAGKTRGAIIVGIWNTGLGRFPEYMPGKAVSGDRVPLHIAGGPDIPAQAIQSDAYLKFLVEEVKPWIDRTYRTKPDAPNTFVMGSSMGGLISAYALAEYPGVFGGAGCVSTHWPAGDGAVIVYLAKHLPKAGAHKLYFDFGTATLDAAYAPYQQRMDAVMRKLGYTAGRDWLTKEFPGAEHSEKSWRARVETPLSFLLGP